MRQALSWSSNIGMVTLEQRMTDRWQQYLQQFGFGRSTYSGLPNENTGIMPENNPVSQAMTSFGQAIGVTNFQMMQALPQSQITARWSSRNTSAKSWTMKQVKRL